MTRNGRKDGKKTGTEEEELIIYGRKQGQIKVRKNTVGQERHTEIRDMQDWEERRK